MINLVFMGYMMKEYNIVNNILTDSVNKQINQLIQRGFISFFITHRKHRGRIRVKLSYSGLYHYMTHIDSMDDYNGAASALLSTLLNRSIGVVVVDDLDVLRRELNGMMIGLNRTHYKTNSQLISLNKLIPKRCNIDTYESKFELG